MNKPFNDPSWLDDLVDDELSSNERAALFEYLEENGRWKQCAMAFINAQTLSRWFANQDWFDEQSEVNEAKESAEVMVRVPAHRSKMVPPSTPAKPPAQSLVANTSFKRITRLQRTFRHPWWSTMAALMVGFVLAWTWQSQVHVHAQQTLLKEKRGADQAMSELVSTIADIEKNQSRLLARTAIIDDRTTCLIEIVDNDLISIFDTPSIIPSLFLETLVMAGHDVNVSRYRTGDSQMMHRLTVRKSPRT